MAKWPPHLSKRLWHLLQAYPLGVAGAAVLILLALLAAAAPLFPLPNPDAINPLGRLRPIFSSGSPLGTDELGRDIMSRLVWGGRVSLVAGIGAMLIAASIGVTIGLVAGYTGGLFDMLCMRVIDVVLAFPAVILAISVVATLGPGLTNAMLAVAIVGFPLYARAVRALALSLRHREFVEAARTLGASNRYIIIRHLLPNLLGPIVVLASLDIGTKILITASLGFLGLGAQPPTADWGNMLAAGRDFVTIAPHVAILPGLFILLAVFGANLVGDAIRDALDPQAVKQLPSM